MKWSQLRPTGHSSSCWRSTTVLEPTPFSVDLLRLSWSTADANKTSSGVGFQGKYYVKEAACESTARLCEGLCEASYLTPASRGALAHRNLFVDMRVGQWDQLTPGTLARTLLLYPRYLKWITDKKKQPPSSTQTRSGWSTSVGFKEDLRLSWLI